MNWVNIHTATLRSEVVLSAEPHALGIWLRVLAYSCEQENSGRIKGASKWTDRQWLYSCGVSKSDVDSASPLLVVDGEDVVVAMYPIEKQKEVAKDRANGKKGGRCKTQAKTQASRENGTQGGRPKNPSQNPTERKGKEGEEERKEKGKEVWAALPLALDTPEFRKVWCEWIAFRKLRKFPQLLPESVVKQWESFVPYGPEVSIRAINASIANAYQGIFPEKHITHPINGTNGHRLTFKEEAQQREADLHKQTSRHGI